jgi:hypothetical protein
MKLTTIYLLALLLYACNVQPEKVKTIQTYDICIFGGTSAGVIAAYTAQSMGKSVIIIEPGFHLGGLSASGLGQTDTGNKEAVTGLSRDFYRRLGKEYGKFEAWRFEPHKAEKVFNDYISEGNIPVMYEKWLFAVEKHGSRIISASFLNPETKQDTITIKARIFIDCTYEGDLMAMAGVSYTIGRESNETYNEQYNGVQLLPDHHQFPDGISPYIIPNDPGSGLLPGIQPGPPAPRGSGDNLVQAYNFRLCLTQDTTNMIPFFKPEKYYPEEYELLIRWINTKKDWRIRDFGIFSPMPNGKTDTNNKGAISTDFIGRNWDYPEADYETRQEIIQFHKHYTQGYFYFLATDPRVPENVRKEAQSWGYAKDEFINNQGFPHQIYVREARRMIGEYVMTEHDCLGKTSIADGVGMGAYGMDSHHCQRIVVNGMVKNEGNINIEEFPPYPISYRSITPKREECDNLLVPVALSASHIAFGSIRMEPVFMVLGQSAALAACMAIDNDSKVQEIDVSPLQHLLETDPFLDGKPLEIVLDDNDQQGIYLTGNWTKIERNEIPQPYRSTYRVLTDGTEHASALFKPEVKEPGLYDVFVYHPFMMGIHQHSSKTVYRVISGDSADNITIDFTQYPINQFWGEWVKLGTWHFSENTKTHIELLGAQSQPPLVVDAMVLSWSDRN